MANDSEKREAAGGSKLGKDGAMKSLVQVESLIQLALVKKPLFRLHGTRMDDPNLLAISPIHTKYSASTCALTQVKKPGLNREPRRIWQNPHRKGVFKRLLNLLPRQRTT